MSENTLEGNGKAFLVLLLPISFLIIFLVSTWKILLAFMLVIFAFNTWQRIQWQKWCQQVNPIFNRLVLETQGKVTPMDLAIKGNFSGSQAKRYLDTKANEFGASILNSEDESPVYYFINATILGSILESSEPPVKELPPQPVVQTAQMLLEPPPAQEQQEEETEDELLPPATHEEPTIPLEKQLVFGSLIQSELAKRLNVYSSTVYKRRNDPDFPEWSRSRDPDGIAWSFSRKSKEFFPLEDKA